MNKKPVFSSKEHYINSMNKRVTPCLLLCISLTVFSGCGSPFMRNIFGDGAYTGLPGKGTELDPWIVHNVETLLHVGKPASGTKYADWGLDKHYRQVRDITLPGSLNWDAIGTISESFKGSYDGFDDQNNKYRTITGLKIASPPSPYQGMFGYIAAGATARNVTLVDIAITSTVDFNGGVAGRNDGIVENCHVTGSILGGDHTGGVVGSNDASGEIQNCSAAGTVTGFRYIGGVAGNNGNSAKVYNCFAANSVASLPGASYGYAGGVVGNNNSLVEYCYATGGVNGGNFIGGIVGYNGPYAFIKYCVALNEYVESSHGTERGRVAGKDTSLSGLYGNYGLNPMQTNGFPIELGALADENGENVDSSSNPISGGYTSLIFWNSTMNWTFTPASDAPWRWTPGKMPHLFSKDAQDWLPHLK